MANKVAGIEVAQRRKVPMRFLRSARIASPGFSQNAEAGTPALVPVELVAQFECDGTAERVRTAGR